MYEIPRQSFYCVGLEKVRAILKSRRITFGHLVQMKTQIKLGRLRIEVEGSDLQISKFQLLGRHNLQNDLKNGIAAWIPFKFQVFNGGFKRQVRIGEGIQ